MIMESKKNIGPMYLPNGKEECTRQLVASVQLPPVAVSYLKATCNPGTAETVKAFAELDGKLISCKYRLRAGTKGLSVVLPALHDNQMGVLIAIIKWLIKQDALSGMVLVGFDKISKNAMLRALRSVLDEVMYENGISYSHYTEILRTYGWVGTDYNRHKRFHPLELLKVEESGKEPYSRDTFCSNVAYVSRVTVDIGKHGNFTILTTNLPYKRLLESYEEVPSDRIKNVFLRIILKKDTEI